MKSLPFGVLMLLSLLISAAVSFGITPIVKRMAYKVGAVDVPKDARRMHSVPIPRLGGLAIAIAFLLTVLLFANVDEQMRGILLGAVVILVLPDPAGLVQIPGADFCGLFGDQSRLHHPLLFQPHCDQLGAVSGSGQMVCAHYHCLDCSHYQCRKLY